METNYKIADINIAIKTPFEYKEEDRYIPFISSRKSDSRICVSFDYTEKENTIKYDKVYDNNLFKVYKQENKFIREFHDLFTTKPYGYLIQDYEKLNDNKFYLYNSIEKKVKNTNDIFQLIAFEDILCNNEAFILHSSYIKWKNKAILFSAPSGIGKSTQANLWEKYENAEIINGDRVVIRKNYNKWNAYGLPFAGSSHIYKNIKTPIEAIVILRQGKENKISKLSQIDGFKYIYSETTVNSWNEKFVDKISDIISTLVKDIPVYLLICKPDVESVKLLKNTLQKEIDYE